MLEIKAVVYSPQLDTDFLFFTTENDLAEIEWPNAQAEKLTKARGLEGKFGELGSFQFEQNSQIRRLLTVGLGKTEELDLEKMRRALGQALQEAEKLKVKNLTIAPLAGPAFPVFERARVLTEAAVMASYRFERYLAEKKGVSLASLQLAVAEGDLAQAEQGLELGLILGRATNLARDLVNEPANCLTPEQLAQKARQAGEGSGFEVEILDENSIVKLGMKAFLEVGKASANRPKLIIMRHLGNPEDPEDILGLVGKGITFDSGGLSIKPGASMATMKFDMGGAAAVIGAMSAIARRELPLNVVAVVAACENLISGRGYRPGDIIGTMAGKNILINSTDAEGRLTLADAVHYIISEEGAQIIVDVATLTGAAIVALGNTTTAVLSNDAELFKKVTKASDKSGERIWQLPSFPEYRELNKTPLADLKNTGGRGAGTITAGLFIEEFVEEKPWLHLDIAGTAFTDKDRDYLREGATGVGVRLLYHFAEEFLKS